MTKSAPTRYPPQCVIPAPQPVHAHSAFPRTAPLGVSVQKQYTRMSISVYALPLVKHRAEQLASEDTVPTNMCSDESRARQPRNEKRPWTGSGDDGGVGEGGGGEGDGGGGDGCGDGSGDSGDGGAEGAAGGGGVGASVSKSAPT